MRKIIILVFVCCAFLACDKEVVVVKGKFDGVCGNELVVKMKGLSGKHEKILDTVSCKNGEFEFKIKMIKPPLNLLLCLNDSVYTNLWIGNFGSKSVSWNGTFNSECKVEGSFFADEINRIQDVYNKMYLNPISSKIETLSNLNKRVGMGEVLTSGEEQIKFVIENEIKKANGLRKKSILKTVRKNPNNPVSMALLAEEFDKLTTWQKKEAKKYMSKYFSDTGLNWQIKN